MITDFETWLEGLPVQTLTDELKDDIVTEAKAACKEEILKAMADYVTLAVKMIGELENIKKQIADLGKSL